MMNARCERSTESNNCPSPRRAYRRGWLVASIALILVFVGWSSWAWFSNFYPWGLRATLKGHSAAIRCLGFAPDGDTLATGSDDGTLRLWDLNAGKTRAIV